ncbi:MAG: penicillin-binding protein 2 [SAR86 cluster bacterium]|uniref:Peptidoglycan D,D-transpeptidase MrdA n=1 Tax=SAR86 cluster bacterium TaxID=2030880 RepID=A0A2A5CBJ8_9GAMM|nr:MAG: penicillin-binding protein 2 [SAR86 cluster bacterium]
MINDITLKDHTQERRTFLSRLLIGGIITILLVGFLISRLIYLQIYQHEYYSTVSDNNRIYRQTVVPTRGLIYDRNGILLADNKPSFNLTVIREKVSDMDASISLIQSLIDLPEQEVEEFKQRLRRRGVPLSSVPVTYALSEDEIAKLAVNQFHLPGFQVEAQLVRSYPLGAPIAHALGYLSSITEAELRNLNAEEYRGTHQMGKIGIERFYESLLHGQVGYETVEKNARGQIMKVLDRVDPVPGEDLVLHLDSQLQLAAWEALGDYRGGVVALDVATGGVLAMVSKPAFDPNLFVSGISQAAYSALNDPVETPLFNRALAKYAPGSTMKPFIGLAGLDFGVRTREYQVQDPGYFILQGDSHIYHDWTWWITETGHDLVNLAKAIYQSCDTYFWDMALDLGIDQMAEFLDKFGFGQNTSVDISQASQGTLPSRAWKMETLGQPWYPGETLNSAIGQGYTEATPLQLATATMVLANKGQWRQPMLLKRVGLLNEDIQHESAIPDVTLKNPDDWNFMHQAMQDVVHKDDGGYRNNGTAYPYITMLEKMPYHMAGKSGTAQVIGMAADFDNDAEVPERYRDHALFISFAPVENPSIALAVFIEHGVGGSGVAGPIAKIILDAYLLDEFGEVKQAFLAEPEQEPELQISSIEAMQEQL